jgi:hypothetical protein
MTRKALQEARRKELLAADLFGRAEALEREIDHFGDHDDRHGPDALAREAARLRARAEALDPVA